MNIVNKATASTRLAWACLASSGFREYYNPFKGEGHGAENFTWSGLVVDMINRQRVKEGTEGKRRSA